MLYASGFAFLFYKNILDQKAGVVPAFYQTTARSIIRVCLSADFAVSVSDPRVPEYALLYS